MCDKKLKTSFVKKKKKKKKLRQNAKSYLAFAKQTLIIYHNFLFNNKSWVLDDVYAQ